MALLVISGEIDLSVAAIIALASTAMGAAAQLGVGTPGLVLIGIGTGLACGIFNGVLVSVDDVWSAFGLRPYKNGEARQTFR